MSVRRAEARARAQLAHNRDPLEFPNALWHPHALDLADDVLALLDEGLTAEQAELIARIALTADGGCASCGRALLAQLIVAFPEQSDTFHAVWAVRSTSPDPIDDMDVDDGRRSVDQIRREMAA